MIEVEKWFQPTDEQLKRMVADSEFLGEVVNHDVYYDYSDFRIFKNYVKFRSRNGVFEVKIEIKVDKRGQNAEKEIEEEERREREHIKVATDEACHRAAAIINRRNSVNLTSKPTRGDVGHLQSQGSSAKQQTDSDDEVELEELKLKLRIEPSHSARGVWSYTVGLVGKPSAGKQ